MRFRLSGPLVKDILDNVARRGFPKKELSSFGFLLLFRFVHLGAFRVQGFLFEAHVGLGCFADGEKVSGNASFMVWGLGIRV